MAKTWSGAGRRPAELPPAPPIAPKWPDDAIPALVAQVKATLPDRDKLLANHLPRMVRRLGASASGYIRQNKLGPLDKRILMQLVNVGLAVIADSPLGMAYWRRPCPAEALP